MRRPNRNSIVGWGAMALGLATAATPVWTDTTAAATGLTLGLGALTVIYAMWSLLARNPTKDHWTLSVIGLMLFISPWVGGFVAEGAGWVAWTTGLLLALLAGTAYVSDEAGNVAEAARVDELVTYRLRQIRHHEIAGAGRSNRSGSAA
ncbi:SPW repeat domain-containing protein [Nocardia rhamnosiphila]|uniref:SPW repeat domain-containing protein n=1 Tax=Nocardia rhamnosiphila TaxID=426716 RepID=UPI0009DFC3D5|nr:SPW repeat protein [Nocardia rhamnosiphila]